MRKPISVRPIVAAALAASVIALPIAAGARQGQGAASSAGSLALDFRAVGQDGQPILDLQPSDVTLKVDGRQRDVKSLQLVRFKSGGGALPAPYATNQAAGELRSVTMLVDEESVTPGREQLLRDAASAVIASASPSDRLGIVSVRQGGVNIAPTGEHAKVRAALAGINGHGSEREQPQDLVCRTSRLLGVLQSVFAAASRNKPATIIFFSASVAALQAGQMTQVGPRVAGRLTEGEGSGLCQLRTDHFQALTAAAQAARPHLFVVELMEVGGPQTLREASGGLENIAGATGGEFMKLNGTGEAQMSRILRETSAHYIATFEPDASERTGTNRRVELTVGRAGASVKARSDVIIPKAAVRRAGATPRDMIRSADPFTDLPLRATAFSTRNTGDDKIKVVVLFEAIDPAAKIHSATIGLFDEKGTLKGQWNAQSGDLAKPTVMAAVAVPAGKYRLRVAATDAGGRSGAVDSDLSVALIAAGPIGLSDVAFGSASQSGLTPVIQFGGESAAIAFLELYGRPAGPIGARIELARSVDGTPLTAVPLTPAATSEPDRFVMTGTIPLTSLEPGDYFVRAIIGVQGQPEGRVVRTLRKVRSGS